MDTFDRERFEQQYVSSIKERLRFFVQKGLLAAINDYQTVNNWISQFPENSMTPYFLLDTLTVLTREQVEASLRNIIEQIKASIYVNNPNLTDVELFQAYEKHIESSVFISACKPGHTAGGAPETLRALRTTIGKKFEEIAVTDVCKSIKEKKLKHIYVVDDFIGTGETICKILSYEYLCDNCTCGDGIKKCSLHCAAQNNRDVKFAVISIIMHEQGKEKITEAFNEFELMHAFSVNDSYDLLSDKCTLYRDSDYKDTIIADIKKIMNDHHMTKNIYALHLPVGISGSFPNNSLELFWWGESSEWEPLIRRQH